MLLGALQVARRAGPVTVRVASPAGRSAPEGSSRQPDDRRESPPRASSVLRHPPLGQRHLSRARRAINRSCAFTDGRPRALGSTGQAHARSAMSLTNVAFNASYGWADPTNPDARSADGGADVQRASDRDGNEGQRGGHRRARSRPIRPTRRCSARRFPGSRSRSTRSSRRSPRSSARSISANSPLDRYLYRDDRSALTPQAQRGMTLFFSDRLACAHCHTGFNLSGPTIHERQRRYARRRSTTPASTTSTAAAHIRRSTADCSTSTHARGRHGALSRADAAEYRRDRAVHARRQHPDARAKSSGTTRPAGSRVRSRARG